MIYSNLAIQIQVNMWSLYNPGHTVYRNEMGLTECAFLKCGCGCELAVTAIYLNDALHVSNSQGALDMSLLLRRL